VGLVFEDAEMLVVVDMSCWYGMEMKFAVELSCRWWLCKMNVTVCIGDDTE
ncbi:hypothetical protein MKW98_026994, partial [Papaver atlanticum]